MAGLAEVPSYVEVDGVPVRDVVLTFGGQIRLSPEDDAHRAFLERLLLGRASELLAFSVVDGKTWKLKQDDDGDFAVHTVRARVDSVDLV
jgi:hypothetical protein